MDQLAIIGIVFGGLISLCTVTACYALIRVRDLRKRGLHDRLDLASRGIAPGFPQAETGVPYFERTLGETSPNAAEESTRLENFSLDALLLDLGQLGHVTSVLLFSCLAPLLGVICILASIFRVFALCFHKMALILHIVYGGICGVFRVVASSCCECSHRVCIDIHCHTAYKSYICTFIFSTPACSPLCRLCLRSWCERLALEAEWEEALGRARDSNDRIVIPTREEFLAQRRKRMATGDIPASPARVASQRNQRTPSPRRTATGKHSGPPKAQSLSPPAGSRRSLESMGLEAQRRSAANPGCGEMGAPASPVLVPSLPQRRQRRSENRLSVPPSPKSASLSSIAAQAFRSAWYGTEYPPRLPLQVRRRVNSFGNVVDELEVSAGEEEEEEHSLSAPVNTGTRASMPRPVPRSLDSSPRSPRQVYPESSLLDLPPSGSPTPLQRQQGSRNLLLNSQQQPASCTPNLRNSSDVPLPHTQLAQPRGGHRTEASDPPSSSRGVSPASTTDNGNNPRGAPSGRAPTLPPGDPSEQHQF